MNRHLPRRLIGGTVALALLGATGTAYADIADSEDIHPPNAQSAPLESNIRNGGPEEKRVANAASNLEALSGSKTKGRSQVRTQSASDGGWQTFAEGWAVNGVQDIEDPATSIYVGGDVAASIEMEMEGSMVVDGNLTVTGSKQGLLAGKVNWGMGFNPPAGADMLAVGGKFRNLTETSPQWVGGASRFGGDVRWTDSADTNAKGNEALYIATKGNLQNMGWSTTSSRYRSWPYDNLPKGTVIKQRLGKTEALKVNVNGKSGNEAKIVDYNDFTSSTLMPLSDQLANMPSNGTISYERAPSDDSWLFYGNGDRHVKIEDEGRIIFHGTGTDSDERQVFSLDLDELETQRKALGIRQWSLDFENIPDNQAIVINARGSDNQVWHTGWRVWVNGQDHSTYIDSVDETKSRFRSIASRIMWNFPNIKDLTVDSSYGIYLGKSDSHAQTGQEVYSTYYGKGSLFPGSILLPRGNMTDYADTNGRILVGKNLNLDIWEHHNAPWIGFDEPQKFTLQGKTKTTGAKHRNQDSVQDVLSIRIVGANADDEALDDLRLQGLSFTLNYRGNDSNDIVSATLKAEQSITVPKQGTVQLRSPAFTPDDLGMSVWRPGDYWFDVSVSDLVVFQAETTTKTTITKRLTLDGSSDADEQFHMDPWIGTASTTASNTFAQSGGKQVVHDDILMEYEDGPDTIDIVSTLHWSTDPKATSADSSQSKRGTVTATGSSPGPDFTPSDFGWSQWKAGKYWYDLTIPAQGDFQELTVEGALDGQESWIAKNPFTINLRKVAYLGKPGSGAWTNQPVPNASLTLQEMADGTFKTVKPDSEPISLNTDENGDALAPDMTIGSGETRWYRLSEAAAPDGYLRAEGYWLIEATGTEDGVGVSVTGSDDTMGGLTHGVSSEGIVWTIGIGNRVEGGITPPVTGGSFDTGRMMLASGGLASAMMLAGATLLRSRGRGASFGARAGRHAQA